jgi:hypothetical protein
MRIGLFACLLLSTIVQFNVKAGSLAFYVEGTVKGESLFADGNVGELILKADFEVWISQGGWSIVVSRFDEVGHESRTVYTYDGINVYSYLWSESWMIENPNDKYLPGTITPGPIPLSANRLPFLIWFIYCSEEFFRNREVDGFAPAPFAYPGTEYVTLVTDANLTFSGSGLPNSGEFFTSNEAKRRAIANAWVDHLFIDDAISQLDYFVDGFRLGGFEVSETYHNGGIEIPTKVTANQFWPHEALSHEIGYTISYDLLASGVEVNVEGRDVPSGIPEGFSITARDYRLRDLDLGIDGYIYNIENRVWPTVPPEEAIAAFELNRGRIIAVDETQSDTESERAIGIIVVIVLLGLFPVVILLFRR